LHKVATLHQGAKKKDRSPVSQGNISVGERGGDLRRERISLKDGAKSEKKEGES